MKELTLLSRVGCVQTDVMRANLDRALSDLRCPADYKVAEIETLEPSDARIGYPTPTLLYKDRDLFGLPVPKPPFPDPT